MKKSGRVSMMLLTFREARNAWEWDLNLTKTTVGIMNAINSSLMDQVERIPLYTFMKMLCVKCRNANLDIRPLAPLVETALMYFDKLIHENMLETDETYA